MQALIEYQVKNEVRMRELEANLDKMISEVRGEVHEIGIQELNSEVDKLLRTTRTLAKEVSQHNSETFPNKLEANLNSVQCNAIFVSEPEPQKTVLRNGKMLETPKEEGDEVRIEVEYLEGVETDIEDMDDEVEPIAVEEVVETRVESPKQKDNELKSAEEEEIEDLSIECNAIFQEQLPNKDGGRRFSVPCNFGGLSTMKALCDLGSEINLMPYSVSKKLGLVNVEPTRKTLHFADKSMKTPMGIAKNILVKVDKLILPVDFVILDMVEDPSMPLILGMPFLHMAKAKIDLETGKLTLCFGNKVAEFGMSESKHSENQSYRDLLEDCPKVNVKDPRVEQEMLKEEPKGLDKLKTVKAVSLENETIKQPTEDEVLNVRMVGGDILEHGEEEKQETENTESDGTECEKNVLMERNGGRCYEKETFQVNNWIVETVPDPG